MESFEIKERTKLSVTIYGKEFKILKPNVMQTRAVLQKITALTDSTESSDIWIGFLCELGFEKELLETMEPEHLLKLIDFVTGVKKN
jgi:hypothetical protein